MVMVRICNWYSSSFKLACDAGESETEISGVVSPPSAWQSSCGSAARKTLRAAAPVSCVMYERDGYATRTLIVGDRSTSFKSTKVVVACGHYAIAIESVI